MASRLLFDINFGRRKRKQRIYRHFDYSFEEEEYRERYRFSKESVQYLTELLEPQLCRPTLRSHSLSSQNQVEMALRFYATGDKMKTIGDTLGFHVSSVSRSVRDVSDALTHIAKDFIKWPDNVEKQNIKRGFFSVAGFPGVVGAVDGTHIRIIGPSEHENVYVNRKGYHSLNVQGICDHQGRFRNIVAKWPGSNHDSFIFRESDLGAFLEARHKGIDVDGVLLGDSGYACSRYLLTPFLRPISDSQKKYNDAHTKTRAVIERCFGWWKRRFMVLHDEIRCTPERVTKIVTACAVLHNIAIDRREEMIDGNDSDGEDDSSSSDGSAPTCRNDNIRQFIVDNFF